jgi:hypothetical protein
MYRYFVIALLSLSFWPAKMVGQETQKEPPPPAQEPAAPNTQTPPSDQPQNDQQKAQSPQPEQTPAEKEATQAPADKESPQAPAKNESQPASKKETTKSSKQSAQKDNAQGSGEPHKVVIHRGSIGEPKAQLAPGMTEEQANHNRQNAKQLMASTENNLQKLSGRSLSASQQDTVGQIRNYMGLAKTALDKGDPQRARNLAFKAHLLSDDLIKH